MLKVVGLPILDLVDNCAAAHERSNCYGRNRDKGPAFRIEVRTFKIARPQLSKTITYH